MTRRTKAREVALQLLFQHDLNAVPVPRPAVKRFVADRLADDDAEAFALTLYDGVLRHQKSIDETLTKTAEKWRLSRMMPVDRNVLRIGTFELLHSPEQAATAVVLNEAIEIARRYATADSPGFVNGVLDKIAQSRPKPDAAPAATPVT